MSKSMADPAPTDLEIAQAALPMGVYKRSQPKGNDGRSRTDQVERGSRQDQTEASQGIGSADFARFQLETGGFIVQEVFFQVKTQAIFVKGMQIGWIITE